jgi:hypothetical protein
MDLSRFVAVVRRFRIFVGAGITFALLLALFSMLRVSSHGIAYRQSQSFVAYQTTLVTQAGFPWGSLNGRQSAAHAGGADVGATTAADIGRLTALAIIYSKLADSDPIRALVTAHGVRPGVVDAAALPATTGSTEAIPVISIAAYGSSAHDAITRARATSAALAEYVTRQQDANQISDRQRVVLATLARADAAKLVSGRSKSLPIVIFLALAGATIAVAFVLETLRPAAGRSDREAPAVAPAGDLA